MVDANELGKTKRMNIKDLAPHEEAAIREQGMPIDADGFVDIQLAAQDDPQQMVDPKQDQRNDAIDQLMGAVERQAEQGPQEEAPAPSPAAPARSESDLEQFFAIKEENKALLQQIKETPDKCPRCNWHVHERPDFMPTTEQRRVFLKSVLAGKPYEQDIELLDGEMVARFRTRYAKEEQLINAAISEAANNDLISTADMMYTHLRRFNFAFSFIGVGEKKSFTPRDAMSSEKCDFQGLVHRVDDFLGDLPSQSREILFSLFEQFTVTTSHLIAGATDRDFYGRTG